MDGGTLRKSLGQHHLKGPELCRPIVDFLAPSGRTTIEIGAGGGVLTRALLEAGAEVIAWELDLDWAFEAARRLRPVGRPRLVVGDALRLPWSRLPPGTLVGANLPYNVATPILDRMLDHGDRVERAAVLVQLEVARRLVAGVGDEGYGALSILVRSRARATLLGRVKPGSFHPPPKVESAFVGLELAAARQGAFGEFKRFVFDAFSQRRKTLPNSLAARWGRDEVAAALAAEGVPPSTRAEELDLEAFRSLFSRLRKV